MKVVNIYTDGACSGNQHDTNIGGWGAVLEYGERQKEIFGGATDTTNNRMELLALISALEHLNKSGLTIRVFSDSSYLVNCFKQRWYVGWLRNGWLTGTKKNVENRDLWERLLALTALHSVVFYHVKGHVNLEHPNTKVDAIYHKFLTAGGGGFTKDEFIHITKMNNLADALANKGIDAFRS